MNWISKIFSDYKTMKVNQKVFKIFVKEAADEKESEDRTLMKQYGISISDDKKSLSTIIVLPEQFSRYPDERVIQLKLNDYIQPINHYFWFDMNWLEVIGHPQIYHLEDDETLGIREGEKFSLSFLAVWTFHEQPYEFKNWPRIYKWLKTGFWTAISAAAGSLGYLGFLLL